MVRVGSDSFGQASANGEGYGEGYEEACRNYDLKKNFEKCGSALTRDGSFDEKNHLQGLEEYTFDLADADREAATGEFVVQQVELRARYECGQ